MFYIGLLLCFLFGNDSNVAHRPRDGSKEYYQTFACRIRGVRLWRDGVFLEKGGGSTESCMLPPPLLSVM